MAGALLGALLAKINGRPGRGRQVVIDNFCFRLHYKATFYLLLGLGLFVTGRHYIDHQINCHSLPGSSVDIPTDFLNNHCWVHGTYNKHNKVTMDHLPKYSATGDRKAKPTKTVSQNGQEPPPPGKTTSFERNDYYQWVSLFLIAQSLSFFLPHWLWRQLEGGYLRHLVETFGNGYGNMDTNFNDERRIDGEQLPPADAHAERRGQLVEFLCRHFGTNSIYGSCYVICEVLNLINACGQFLLTDYFLGGRFLGYGWRVLFWREHRSHNLDPQLALFPRVSTCSYERFGITGQLEHHDTVCILPLNALNAKVFLLVYFWLTALVVISTAAILYRILLIVCPHFRWTRKLFLGRFASDSQASKRLVTSVKSQFRKSSPRLYGSDFSDWFVVYYLCKNVHWLDYYRLVDDLDVALGSTGHLRQTSPLVPGAPPLPSSDGTSYFEQNINDNQFSVSVK